jgi:hypothetical protein
MVTAGGQQESLLVAPPGNNSYKTTIIDGCDVILSTSQTM